MTGDESTKAGQGSGYRLSHFERLDREAAQGLRVLDEAERSELAEILGDEVAAARAEVWAYAYRPGWCQSLPQDRRGASSEAMRRQRLQRIAKAAAGLAELLRDDLLTVGELYGIRGMLNPDLSVNGELRPYLIAEPEVLFELDRLQRLALALASITKGKPGKRTAAPDFAWGVDSVAHFLEYLGLQFSSAENAKLTRACRLLFGALGYSGDVRDVLRRLARDRARIRRALRPGGSGGDIASDGGADNAP